MGGVREELLNYYERELAYIRQMGGEWAKKYPKLAGRLLLEPERCEDPHVERLLEGFALLAARVHLKLNDDFPEISTALLESLFPHYIRPIPSMTVVEFQLDADQGKLATGLKIPAGAVLQSGRLNGTACKFRTAYETTLWPVQVTKARFHSSEGLYHPAGVGSSVAALSLELECLPDVFFRTLKLDFLRLHFAGDVNVASTLYELLFSNCIAVIARDLNSTNSKPVAIFDSSLGSPSPLHQVGFAENEGVIPYSNRSFLGFRLLQEYFTFPEKFFFADLSGLELLSSSVFGRRCELTFLFSKFERAERFQMLELGISRNSVKLGCSPAINLFAQTAEPIQADGSAFEHPVVADARRRAACEVYSIDEVLAQDARTREMITYQPLYALRHGTSAAASTKFWHAVRRGSELHEEAPTEMYLSLVDRSGVPVELDSQAVTVKCTCTNGNLPSKLPIGEPGGDFQLEGFAAVRRIQALRRPTPTLRPPLGKATLWHLISHLSLNYLSLVNEGKDALQEILRLYNYSGSLHLRNQINSIMAISSRRHYALVSSPDGGANFARGTGVEMEIDEDLFAGGGVFLFCSVIEHFLGHYVSINSFSQLTALSKQRKEAIREWPPRAGSLILM